MSQTFIEIFISKLLFVIDSVNFLNLISFLKTSGFKEVVNI